MGDVGYRGVSADQDGRYRNKEHLLLKKLASSGQFPSNFEEKVNMKKVNLEVIKPWIFDKVNESLGFEDDVVVEYIVGMLEDSENIQPDPKKMQLSLTGFLEKSTPKFMSELWSLLLSAQNSLGGIPQEFVEKKKQEMREARERDASAIKQSGAIHDYHRSSESRGAAAAAGPSRPFNNNDNNNHGRARGGAQDRGGRGRGDRFDDRGAPPPARRNFVDKSGNKTERVADQGWGARGPVQQRSDPYSSRRGYEEAPFRGSRGYSDDRRPYETDRRPYHRDRSFSPQGRRGPEKMNRAIESKVNHRARSSSSSSSQSSRGRSRSVTPPRIRSKRHRSRSNSKSVSPLLRRRRNRSNTYSRSPSPRRKPADRRNRSRNHSPTLRRPARERSRSRSRSPPPRRLNRRRSRSLSRSYSPPTRPRKRNSSSRSYSPPSRDASPKTK